MDVAEIDAQDQKLIQAATDVICNNHLPGKHSVGAAVLCASGRIYTGINIEACGYGPCAEPVALGAAFANGEREILGIVAVARKKDLVLVLSPCGNCRQLLMDYAPDATVIFDDNGKVQKTRARFLLPGAYRSHFGEA